MQSFQIQRGFHGQNDSIFMHILDQNEAYLIKLCNYTSKSDWNKRLRSRSAHRQASGDRVHVPTGVEGRLGFRDVGTKSPVVVLMRAACSGSPPPSWDPLEHFLRSGRTSLHGASVHQASHSSTKLPSCWEGGA